MLAKLKVASSTVHGLVFAKSGSFSVAFYYNEEGEPQVTEFEDGEVVQSHGIDDAAKRAENTAEKDLWQCYELVCRQFAHPALTLAVYRNEAMRKQ